MRHARHAVHHERVLRFKYHAHFPFHRRPQRRQPRIIIRPRSVLRMLRVILLIQSIILRVKNRLAHGGNDAHQRFRINIRLVIFQIKRHMLENIRLDDGAIGVRVGQRHERARPANDSPVGHNIPRGETQPAQIFQRLRVRMKCIGHPALGFDHGDFISRPNHRARVACLLWNAEKLDSSRRQVQIVLVRRFFRFFGRKRQVSVNESRIDRQAFHVPNPRVGGDVGFDVNALNKAIANDNGRIGENLAGL